jgi:hypothetical protein
LKHDPAFHRREWRVSSIAWLTFLGTMLATALGVFGNGPLSHGRAGDPSDAMWVEYERFVRFDRTHRITVHAQNPSNETVRFVLSNPLRDDFRIIDIVPEPLATTIANEGIEYQFKAESRQSTVVFHLQPTRRWFVESLIRSPEATVTLMQFVYP